MNSKVKSHSLFFIVALLFAGCHPTATHIYITDTHIGAYGDGSFKKDTHVLMRSNGEVSIRGVDDKGDTITSTYQTTKEIQTRLFQDAKTVLDYYKSHPSNKIIYTDSEIIRYKYCPTIGVDLFSGNSEGVVLAHVDTCDPLFHPEMQFAKEMDSLLNTAHLNILPFDKY
jgi:hypothetical protein